MLKRSLSVSLREWKDRDRRTVLLVDGARQIGKTYLIRQFADEAYKQHIHIDFLADDSMRQRFTRISSAQEVIDLLLLNAPRPISFNNNERVLVFFDEVQVVPEIVTFSKYLLEDGRFDIVLSGSLLGVELFSIKSFPVGYLSILTMHALTFEEFAWGYGVPESVLNEVKDAYRTCRALPPATHEKLIDIYRRYIVLGGMPAVVQSHIDSGRDVGVARYQQEELVRLYREDIAQYAGKDAIKVKRIYDALPAQLSKENKRFQLRALGPSAKYDRYANEFSWLATSGVALMVNRVSEPTMMLRRTEEKGRFKLFSHDTGLLMSMYPASVGMDVLTGVKNANYGAVYENVVAQELASRDIELFYYHNNRRGEVDFLAQTQQGEVLPIEVKSGKNYTRHMALDNLLADEGYGIKRGIVLCENNLHTKTVHGKKVDYLPLYMLGHLGEDLKPASQLEQVKLPEVQW